MARPGKASFIVAGAQKGGTSALDVLRHGPLLCPRAGRLRAVPRRIQSRTGAAPLRRGNAGVSVLADGGGTHRALQPGDEAHRGSAQPDHARVFALEHVASKAARALSFLQALEAESERVRALPLEQAKRFTYVDRGFYSRQLERLWGFLPRRQTLVFKSEELFAAPAAVLPGIADFLGIAPFPPKPGKTVHARDYESAMTAEEKRYLVAVFTPEIRALERLLAGDCSAWPA
jgi:hypothetical protein